MIHMWTRERESSLQCWYTLQGSWRSERTPDLREAQGPTWGCRKVPMKLSTLLAQAWDRNARCVPGGAQRGLLADEGVGGVQQALQGGSQVSGHLRRADVAQRAQRQAHHVLALGLQVVLQGVCDQHQHLMALVQQDHEAQVADALQASGAETRSAQVRLYSRPVCCSRGLLQVATSEVTLVLTCQKSKHSSMQQSRATLVIWPPHCCYRVGFEEHGLAPPALAKQQL